MDFHEAMSVRMDACASGFAKTFRHRHKEDKPGGVVWNSNGDVKFHGVSWCLHGVSYHMRCILGNAAMHICRPDEARKWYEDVEDASFHL